MGTVEGKIRDSYTIKQRPCLKRSQDDGCRPILNGSTQNNFFPNNQLERRPSTRKLLTKKSITLTNSETDQILSLISSKDLNFKQYPYCSIGLITYEIGGQQRYGTGFLIAKNIVMTCAHNLFSLDHGEKATSVCFSPCYKGQKQKQLYKAQQIFFSQQFKNASITSSKKKEENIYRNDYGIIKLKDSVDLSNNYGYLGFNFDSKQHDLSTPKMIIGYTHSKDSSIALHCLTGKVELSDELINYPLLTQVGMSGGPIIQKVRGNYIVIGVHTFLKGRGKQTSGQGVRLTQRIFDQISSHFSTDQEVLDLRDKNIGKVGVKQLVKNRKDTLNIINLSRNKLEKDGLKHFSRVQWKHLYHLDIGGNLIGKEGVQYLIKTPMQNLQVLTLWGNMIGKEGVELLIRAKWPKLQNINLYNNQICNEGLELLVKQNWILMNSINLGKNNLDISAVQLLKKSKWKNLVCLNMWGNKIKQEKQIIQTLHLLFLKLKFLYL